MWIVFIIIGVVVLAIFLAGPPKSASPTPSVNNDSVCPISARGYSDLVVTAKGALELYAELSQQESLLKEKLEGEIHFLKLFLEAYGGTVRNCIMKEDLRDLTLVLCGFDHFMTYMSNTMSNKDFEACAKEVRRLIRTYGDRNAVELFNNSSK